MLTRLGNVIFWAACIAAFGILLTSIAVVRDGGSDPALFVLIFLFAALVAAAGWAARYVLAGR